ncbi:hypothetical protein SHKM778_17820 [Streptomyces sp. KM77-8]|uniref:XRE family transcriptional regulator n=1 Tax=Streptomyces haneummycinicus TaxID=3074435 RepID=A0AAT9HD72_9ACTN
MVLTRELIGRPRTLREHRVARGLAPEEVARAVGHELHAYLRMEQTGRWRGSERQVTALTRLLALSLADVVAVTGREDKLAELLRSAATGRWQPYVRAVAKIAPLDRRQLESVLQRLHLDYRGHRAAALSWAGDDDDAGRTGGNSSIGSSITSGPRWRSSGRGSPPPPLPVPSLGAPPLRAVPRAPGGAALAAAPEGAWSPPCP